MLWLRYYYYRGPTSIYWGVRETNLYGKTSLVDIHKQAKELSLQLYMKIIAIKVMLSMNWLALSIKHSRLEPILSSSIQPLLLYGALL